MQAVNRRQFLGGMFSCMGAAAFAHGRLGAPDLKVGILSDIHLSQAERYSSQTAIDAFVRTLEFFKHENVDAVLIAGDLTNDGTVTELKVVADAWRRVFPNAAGAPERIFVTGNHERVYFNESKRRGDFGNPRYADGLYRDVRANWKAVFGEEWSPFFIKTIKGYAFVGAHWAEWNDEKALRTFLVANRSRLPSSQPFFYTQHAHPQDTCYGRWTWHQGDGGPTHKILADYPNAVAFSGHTHYSITDERSVWQGSFTSIGTGSMRWLSMPGGRENGPLGNGEGTRMPNCICGTCPQGMVMSVWGGQMVFERYDLGSMEKLGDDWVVPVLYGPGDDRKFAFLSRAAKSHPPEFPEGAEILVSKRTGKDPKKEPEQQIVVTFPAAIGPDSLSRAFDYEVMAQYVECDTEKPVRTKRVYQPGITRSVAHTAKMVTCVFGECELPMAPYRFVVTPMNAFGRRGRPLHIGMGNASRQCGKTTVFRALMDEINAKGDMA